MQKSVLIALFALFCGETCFSQILSDPLAQGVGSQPNTTVDCSDPAMANSALCNASQSQRPNGVQIPGNSSLPARTPVLNTPNAYNQDQFAPSIPPLNPSQLRRKEAAPKPETEFEQMVADSVGRPLPLFGQSLFIQAPSTFSPVDWMQVPSDYVIGPGDELQIKIWGQVEASLRVIVDRSGQVYIPQVGQVSVAGLHYGDLEEHLKRDVGKVFKNFNLTANIGHLRSIQALVVGEARYPGTYTISSLSTLVNAIFASGGPSSQGSLRHIQLRRDGVTISDFDFYDLLIRGDKSKDVRLQPGDVLYYPHVGPLVAIAGSVNTPAIYEMKADSALSSLIEAAGNLSTVADTNKVTIDRLVDHQARKTLEFPYDEQSQSQVLQDGDIVHVFSIVPRFEDTVTLRGNVANPGRYQWKPGMRVRDLIPNAQALLTRRYWRNRAAIVNGRSTEYPVRTVPTANNRTDLRPTNNGGALPSGLPSGVQESNSNSDSAYNRDTASNPNSPYPNTISPDDLPDSTSSSNLADAFALQEAQNPGSGTSTRPGTFAQGNQQSERTSGNNPEPGIVQDVAEDVRRYAPEINWDYAIIQRVNPEDLSSKLLWMSPRKAIIENDEASNLELKPGDIVTIFSQKDISVPQADRSQYVILEGEVVRPGVYKLETNETMRSVLQRAGGLTSDAYVYGTQFSRESARIDQQKSLDELARTMEVQIRQTAVAVAASAAPGDLPQMLAAQQAIIDNLKNTRATGRVALPVRPKDRTLFDFPDMIMEDNDRLTIPHTPSTVAVVGDVYNPGSFIFEPRNTTGQYLDLAGKGKPQSDLHHAFVLRANGVVVAANNVNGVFTGKKFDRIHLFPGDEVIVPYRLPTGAFVRGLKDWTQITSQLAITGAALAIVAP